MPRPVPVLIPVVLLLLAGPSTAVAQQPAIAGQVVDTQDGAIPRVFVRLLDAAGTLRAAALTDDRGRFTFDQRCEGCRIQAALTGFLTATVPAGPAPRLVLEPAPVQESVVVTATRDAAPTSQVGSSVTVFDAAAIERRGTPLVADLLRSAPGVTVVRTGGVGNVTSMFVRGGESSYNKVLLDGVPINEPGGTFNFGNLTTGHLERIELVRGAQSALFGSDAMSSVVQLFTRRGEPGATRPVIDLGWEGGSYDTQRAAATIAGGAGGFDYAVGVSRFDTANRSPNNDFDNTTVTWNAGTDLGRGLALRLIGRLEDQRVGTPGTTAFGAADLDAFFDRRDVTTGVTLEHRAAALKQRGTYAYTRTSQTSTNLIADPPYTPLFPGQTAQFDAFDFLFDSHNVIARHHASYQADWRQDGAATQFVTALVDYDGERATLDNRLAGTVVKASRDNVGVSGQYQVVFDRAAIVGGLRLEHNESFGTAVAPRLSLAVTLADGRGTWGRTLLKANAGRGVKEPTILQSFSPSPFFLGNPDLEPEIAVTADVGVEQRLFDDRLRVEAVWFDNRYRNQISTRTTNPATFEAQYFNIGRTHARGLEFVADVVPAPGWHARAGYTFLDSEIVESTSNFSPVFAEGQWAFRRPRHSGFIDAGWTGARASVSVFGLIVGRRVDSDFGTFDPGFMELPRYAVWTVAGSYRVQAPIEIYARVENLTDADYMEPVGYLTWGRTAHAGIRLRFR